MKNSALLYVIKNTGANNEEIANACLEQFKTEVEKVKVPAIREKLDKEVAKIAKYIADNTNEADAPEEAPKENAAE